MNPLQPSPVAVNRLQPPAVAGKLTDPGSSHALLRSNGDTNRRPSLRLSLAPLLALLFAFAFSTASARAAEQPRGATPAVSAAPTPQPTGGCPDEQARIERNSTTLPNCRAYELVTPPKKNGALIGALYKNDVPPRIAEDGQRVIAPSIQCFSDPESCTGNRQSEGDPYAFTRTPNGWTTTPLAPPAKSYEANSWWSINANTGDALFTAPSEPESITDDFLARDGETVVNLGPVGESANYRAFRESGVVATADLSHVVYQTSEPVWSFDTGESQASLYEYAGEALPLMVGVAGGYGSRDLVSTCGTPLGNTTPAPRARDGSLSEDGRIVYFDALPECSTALPVEELYGRIDGEQADARSVDISQGPPADSCTSHECQENTTDTEDFRAAFFEGASTDGSRVFFTDTQQLTNGASESPDDAGTADCHKFGGPGDSGCNLYESECPHCDELGAVEEQSKRRLVDVSEGAREAGGPRVQGVLATSADGSHVYFVAKGVLTGSEENAYHERAESEKDNLYVYSEGHRAFIGRLSPVKEGSESVDEEEWSSQKLIANATPEGQFLVFTSHRALTPDDTYHGGVEDREGPAQVYEYDSETKSLIRVSVGEDGYNDDGNAGTGNAKVAFQGLESFGSVPIRTDPTMSNDGSYVFFQSPIALVPGALNDVPVGEVEGALDEGLAQNVYEYHAGRVSLISDGRDTGPTAGGGDGGKFSPVELLGSDVSGRNVFFATFDRLVPEDIDTQRDYYDAHVCSEGGVEPEPCSAPTQPEKTLLNCEGEACQGNLGAPPSLATPGSNTLTGEGSLASPTPAVLSPPKTAAEIKAEQLAKALKACKKDKKKSKRKACEKQAKSKYGTAKKSSNGKGRA